MNRLKLKFFRYLYKLLKENYVYINSSIIQTLDCSITFSVKSIFSIKYLEIIVCINDINISFITHDFYTFDVYNVLISNQSNSFLLSKMSNYDTVTHSSIIPIVSTIMRDTLLETVDIKQTLNLLEIENLKKTFLSLGGRFN